MRSPDLRLGLAKWAGRVEEQVWAIRDLRTEPLPNPIFRTGSCPESDFPDQAYGNLTVDTVKSRITSVTSLGTTIAVLKTPAKGVKGEDMQ